MHWFFNVCSSRHKVRKFCIDFIHFKFACFTAYSFVDLFPLVVDSGFSLVNIRHFPASRRPSRISLPLYHSKMPLLALLFMMPRLFRRLAFRRWIWKRSRQELFPRPPPYKTQHGLRAVSGGYDHGCTLATPKSAIADHSILQALTESITSSLGPMIWIAKRNNQKQNLTCKIIQATPRTNHTQDHSVPCIFSLKSKIY